MLKILNAISGQLAGGSLNFDFKSVELTYDEARKIASEGLDSFVGHPDTANVLSGILGVEVEHARRFATIAVGEKFLLAQLTGVRLPEGATQLPEGAILKFGLVTRLG